jgi:predicted regulator of Ras-like GTPase activity (Roadblock/LC7/MglB family)
MPDAAPTGFVSDDAAEQALAYLAEMSTDLRGAAIFDPEGSLIAASGDAARWREEGAALMRVADGAGEGPVEQVHVGTGQGEVFAVRQGGLTAIAVSERFVLASLMFFDLRSILRDLVTPTAPEEG